MKQQRQVQPIENTEDVLALLKDIAKKRQEYFVVLSLDSRHCVIKKRVVFIGTVDTIIAHPREVYAGAIADRASSIIVAHNHPSGDPTPSEQDIVTTEQLNEAGQILGIRLVEHLIVAGDRWFSFGEKLDA